MIITKTEEFLNYINEKIKQKNQELFLKEAKENLELDNYILNFSFLVEMKNPKKTGNEIIHKWQSLEYNSSDSDLKILRKNIEKIINNDNFLKIILED